MRLYSQALDVLTMYEFKASEAKPFIAIVRYADTNHVCSHSNKQIASLSTTNPGSITKARNKLKELGFIKIIKKGSYKEKTPSICKLTLPDTCLEHDTDDEIFAAICSRQNMMRLSVIDIVSVIRLSREFDRTFKASPSEIANAIGTSEKQAMSIMARLRIYKILHGPTEIKSGVTERYVLDARPGYQTEPEILKKQQDASASKGFIKEPRVSHMDRPYRKRDICISSCRIGGGGSMGDVECSPVDAFIMFCISIMRYKGYSYSSDRHKDMEYFTSLCRGAGRVQIYSMIIAFVDGGLVDNFGRDLHMTPRSLFENRAIVLGSNAYRKVRNGAVRDHPPAPPMRDYIKGIQTAINEWGK